MVRGLTGALLSSPKQPHPMSGRCARSSMSAAVAVAKSRITPIRTAVAAAGQGVGRPAVATSMRPRPNSVAHMAIAAGRRSRSGNIMVGPMPSSIDRDRAARTALPAQARRSNAASSGICISRNAPSMLTHRS